MKKKINYSALIWIGSFICLTSVLIGVFLLFVSYSDFKTNLSQLFHIEYKHMESLISKNKYILLKLMPVFTFVFGVLLIRLNQQISDWLKKIFLLIKTSLLEIYSLPKSIKTTLFFLIISSTIIHGVFALRMPISYDEAWTYINFTQHNFLVSLSYYPAPNNHILHSILTNLCSAFPFSTLVNLRLPNFIVVQCSVILIYLLLYKLNGYKTALVVTISYITLFPVIYYAYCSRGYGLVLLAFIISFYGAIQLLLTKETYNKYIGILSLGGFIGLTSMPSFVYSYFSLNFLLFLYFIKSKSYFKIKALIRAGLILTLIVSFFYLPAILISGLSSITNNTYVASIERQIVIDQLYSHFNQVSHFLFNIPLAFLLLLLTAILIFISVKKIHVNLAWFSFAILIFCPALVVLHSVLPFPRTWIYLIIPVLFIIATAIRLINIKKIVLTISAILISGSNLLFFIKNIDKYETFSWSMNKVADIVLYQEKQNIYCNHSLADANLQFYISQQNNGHNLFYSRSKDINNDILHKKYDYLILENIYLIDEYEMINMFPPNIFLYKDLNNNE